MKYDHKAYEHESSNKWVHVWTMEQFHIDGLVQDCSNSIA